MIKLHLSSGRKVDVHTVITVKVGDTIIIDGVKYSVHYIEYSVINGDEFDPTNTMITHAYLDNL